MNTKVEEIIQKAKTEGEVFLASLSPEELKKTDFTPLEPEEEFWQFDYVDIYLQYTCKEGFKFKYRFWSENTFSDYYETIEEKYIAEIIQDYIGE